MAPDQYRYFRIEARELLAGLGDGVLALERGERGTDLVSHVLRLAHTLKGAARVVKLSGIGDLAHAIEGAFAPLREAQGDVPPERINEVLSWLDAIAAEIAGLGGAPSLAPSGAKNDDFLETVRVEVHEVDALLIGVTEASVELSALRRESEKIGHASRLTVALGETIAHARTTELLGQVDDLRSVLERLARGLASSFDQLETEFAGVRDATNRLRLLPVAILRGSLERAVRDAAQSLAKDVRFVFSGGDTRLEANVLTALRDALFHVVRNAVAHGIEASQERAAVGKPPEGQVELRAERRGNNAVFICSDDGRGIDVAAIREVALRHGLISVSQTAALTLDEAVQLIMQGGVTTTGAVGEISGRGIGLDVLRETVAQLKGTVQIRSESGKGTALEITVPVSAASFNALEVDVGGTVVAIPLDAVRETLRVVEQDIVRSANRDSIICDGRTLPFRMLADVLGRRPIAERRSRSRTCSAVVVETAAGAAVVGVDRLQRVSNIVVRPLSALTPAERTVTGVSWDREGNPQLVLDPAGIVAAVRRAVISLKEEALVKPAPVLVVDDSLTTRMLEQSILESAGYDVELAASAEEALAKARDTRYGLFLVDVEMPGMDGFEFVSRTQADPALRTIPAILVTSRDGAEDRRRGVQVGARAYIVKGEFDQGHLLALLRESIG